MEIHLTRLPIHQVNPHRIPPEQITQYEAVQISSDRDLPSSLQ